MIQITINELFNMSRKGIIHKKYNKLEIFNKDGWIIYPNTIPDNFTYWDIKDKHGWSVAHEAANKGFLPDDFDQWNIANFNGWSVAHVAVGYQLPKDFKQWDIADNQGWTVAHEAAEYGKLPEDFDQWELKDDMDRSVRLIAENYAHPEDFEELDPI